MAWPFKRERTLSDVQEDDDRLTTEVSVARKRAMIRELEARAGRGSWKMFSSDGTKRGLDFGRIWQWLKKH